MDTFAHIAGWVVVCLGMIGLVISMLDFLTARLARIIDRIQDQSRQETREQIATELRSFSSWLSEDVPTMNLIRQIANSVKAGGLDEWRVRGDWREAVTGAQKPDQPIPSERRDGA